MTLHPSSRLAVAELVLFVPCLLGASWVTFRHGLDRRLGWLYLVIFSLVRIVGASCQIASESKHSVGLIEAATILSNVGLTPLLLAMLGLLKRVAEVTLSRAIPPRIFILLNIPFVVGLVLAILGGTATFGKNNRDGTSSTSGHGRLQASVVLFALGFAILCAITAFLSFRRRQTAESERRILLAIYLSIPFLTVRLIYSLVATFDYKSSFNPVTGSAVLRGFMAILEEFIVEVLYIGAGATAVVIKKSDAESGDRWPRRAEDETRLQEVGQTTRS